MYNNISIIFCGKIYFLKLFHLDRIHHSAIDKEKNISEIEIAKLLPEGEKLRPIDKLVGKVPGLAYLVPKPEENG